MWSHGDLNPDLLLANRRPPCTWVFITLEPRSPSAPVYPALDPLLARLWHGQHVGGTRWRAPRKSTRFRFPGRLRLSGCQDRIPRRAGSPTGPQARRPTGNLPHVPGLASVRDVLIVDMESS